MPETTGPAACQRVRVFYEHNDDCMVPAGGDKPVADRDERVRRCVENGGKVPVPERLIPGVGRFCVIEDPAAPHQPE